MEKINKKIENTDIKSLLYEYGLLPSELQKNIFEDFKNQKNSGVASKDILERLKLLIQESLQLTLMSSKNSDLKYSPKEPPESKKLRVDINDLTNYESILEDWLERELNNEGDKKYNDDPSKKWIN